MAPERKPTGRRPPAKDAGKEAAKETDKARPDNKPAHKLQSRDENLRGAVGTLDEPTRADRHGNVTRSPAAEREADENGKKEK